MAYGNELSSSDNNGTLSRQELSSSLQEISRELEGLRSEIEKVGTVAQQIDAIAQADQPAGAERHDRSGSRG